MRHNVQFTEFRRVQGHTSCSIGVIPTEKRMKMGLVKVNAVGVLLNLFSFRYGMPRRVKQIWMKV
jgi:hypothetical protein